MLEGRYGEQETPVHTVDVLCASDLEVLSGLGGKSRGTVWRWPMAVIGQPRVSPGSRVVMLSKDCYAS